MHQQDIYERAAEIVNAYNPEGITPFPFEKIEADKEGLQILTVDNMPPDINGASVVEGNSFLILVNNDKSPTRQYFSVARQLGHYFLHKAAAITSGGFIDGGTYDDENERFGLEASYFAEALIMPEELLRKAWETTKSIDELGEIFKVSPVAMAIRLSRLGMVQ